MSVGRNTAGVFATNVLNLVLSFGNSILLTRTLGLVGRGEFAVFTASVGILSLLLGMGLDASLRFFVARGRTPRDRILGTFLLQVAGATAAVFVLARVNHLLLGNELLLPQARQTPAFELVLAASVGATLFYGTLSSVFAGLRSFRVMNLATVGFSALGLGVYGTLFWLDASGRWGIGSGEIFVAYLSLQGVGALVLTVLAGRILKVRPTFHLLEPALLGEMLRYAGKAWAANVAQFLNYRVDIWIVQHFAGAGPLGLYSLAANLAMMLWVLPRSASTVLLPSMAAGDRGAGFPEAARVSRLVFGVTALLAVPLALGAEVWIGFLYGAPFRPAGLPFALLLLGCVPFTLCVVQAAALAAVDRQGINLAASGLGLVVTVALDLLLIPRMGITGAALASAMSYVLTTAVVLVAFARVGGLPLSACLVPRPTDFRYVVQGLTGLLR